MKKLLVFSITFLLLLFSNTTKVNAQETCSRFYTDGLSSYILRDNNQILIEDVEFNATFATYLIANKNYYWSYFYSSNLDYDVLLLYTVSQPSLRGTISTNPSSSNYGKFNLEYAYTYSSSWPVYEFRVGHDNTIKRVRKVLGTGSITSVNQYSPFDLWLNSWGTNNELVTELSVTNLDTNQTVKFAKNEDNYCALPKKFDYDITDGTDFGKKLTLNFNGYTEDYYVIIQDYISGYYKKLDPLSNFPKFIIDNIPLDNTYTLTFYQNNEIVDVVTIDIANEIEFNNGDRYLDFNVDTKNKRIVFEFKNTKKNDVCFITIGETEEQLPDCTSQYVYDSNNSILNKNSSVLFTIKNDNNLVYKKGYTLNLYDNLPFFNITSSFDTYNSYQIVKLVTENFISSDVISYSYDNINFTTLTTQRINTLNIYNSTDLYFKLERNNEILATSYIYVNFKQFSNSQIDQVSSNISITDFFKNLTSNIDFSFLDNFQTIWLQSKQSKLYLYLILFVIGSLIIFLIHSIRKK